MAVGQRGGFGAYTENRVHVSECEEPYRCGSHGTAAPLRLIDGLPDGALPPGTESAEACVPWGAVGTHLQPVDEAVGINWRSGRRLSALRVQPIQVRLPD